MFHYKQLVKDKESFIALYRATQHHFGQLVFFLHLCEWKKNGKSLQVCPTVTAEVFVR